MTMSITVCVGRDLRDSPGVAADLLLINRMLSDAGLPPHEEPTEIPDDAQWTPEDLPYSFMDRLQRVQAWANQRGELPPPLADGDDARDDPMIADEIDMLDSHLVLHGVTGYFAPMWFDEPLVHDDLTGRILGSSHRLLEDLARSGDALGIEREGEGDLVADAAIEQIKKENGQVGADRSRYASEKLMWFALYDAARRSIKHGALIYHG